MEGLNSRPLFVLIVSVALPDTTKISSLFGKDIAGFIISSSLLSSRLLSAGKGVFREDTCSGREMWWRKDMVKR